MGAFECLFCGSSSSINSGILIIIDMEYTAMRKLNDLRKKGQGLVEYALILVLIAIVVIVILGLLGGAVNNIFSTIASAL